MTKLTLKIEVDMDEMAAEMEANGYFDSVEYKLESLVGCRVVLDRRSPELQACGYLTMSPSGEWAVAKAGIGGEVRGEVPFATKDVASINGTVILLNDEIDFSKLVAEERTETDKCQSCGEDRINHLIWTSDASIRCDSCGTEYLCEAEWRRLDELRWDLLMMNSFEPVFVIEEHGKEIRAKEYEQLLKVKHAHDLWVLRNGVVCRLLDVTEIERIDRRLRAIYVREGWTEGMVTIRK